ncbi:hypothetical protein FQR65_LT17196 [Abscondita terminalis]|nr:hypothetical protein FQR65_LT17196 [Abscondita terminalis]
MEPMFVDAVVQNYSPLTPKYDSGCGWPSFFKPINNSVIEEQDDHSHGMDRVEIICHHCDAHLGHVTKITRKRRRGNVSMTNIYQFEAELLEGENKSFSDYQGKVLLIVNTASKCGFTPQFAGLEKLYEKYKDQGLEVLGFPCNQFGGQDPGTNEQIGSYCQRNYGVSFPMFAKVNVKGPEAHVIFRYLTNNSKGILGNGIKWNFTKFLINKKGEVINRYAPTTKPEDIEQDIEKALAE